LNHFESVVRRVGRVIIVMRPSFVAVLALLCATVACSPERAMSPIVAAPTKGTGAQMNGPISLREDINAADIESIEIVKSPAASAIYGTRCTATVRITTRRRARNATHHQ
jgi:hypothetical protein